MSSPCASFSSFDNDDMADRTGIAWVGELRPDCEGVVVSGVRPAAKADGRRFDVKDGLRDETDELRRLEALDPDRERGGVSANARIDRSNSGTMSAQTL